MKMGHESRIFCALGITQKHGDIDKGVSLILFINLLQKMIFLGTTNYFTSPKISHAITH